MAKGRESEKGEQVGKKEESKGKVGEEHKSLRKVSALKWVFSETRGKREVYTGQKSGRWEGT